MTTLRHGGVPAPYGWEVYLAALSAHSPNEGLQATANSLRSCVAAAIGGA
jgi:hypothetical protein